METALDIQHCISQIPRADYSGSPISFSIGRGEIVSIIGPDYNGKSEWLRTFAGLIRPASGKVISGEISTDCENRAQWEQLRRKLAFVSSETALLSASNGLANVILAASYHQLGDSDDLRDRATELMTQLHVQFQADALPAFMRRDQRYRLALARALMLEPEVLMLDNPFAHTDAAGTGKLKQFLLKRVDEHATALVIMSHDLEFSLKYAQQILFVTREQVYCFKGASEFLGSQVESIRQYIEKPGLH